MALSKSAWEVLEFFGTSGFAVGVNQLLQGQWGETLKKGLEDFQARVDERAKYRVVMWDYVRESGLDMEYSASLLKIHRDALTNDDYARANRIEEIYILVYMTFNDEGLGPKDERDQMRERAFQDLARAAAKDDPAEFDAIMESYERQGLWTYLLIAKQIGVDAWQFLGGPLTAIAEAIGGEHALERAKAYIQDPKRWGPDFFAFRREVHEWTENKTRNMERAYTISIRMAERRKRDNPDHWIRRVAIWVGITLGVAAGIRLLMLIKIPH